MKQLIWSELERTFKRKKTIIMLIVYLLLLGFECLFLFAMGGTTFFDPEHDVKMDSLNSSTLYLRDLAFFLTFILIPMLVVDSFNGEYASGALRLVLIRPQSRLQLFLAKWFIQCFLFFGVLVITGVTGFLFGKIVMPNVEYTVFLGGHDVDAMGAFLYTLKFYGIAFAIFLTIITLASLVSVLMPNAILSYVGLIAILIGSVYASDQLLFFFSLTDSIFYQLSGTSSENFLFLLFPILGLSIIINIMIWKKKEWIG
ncbi:ABC transporter permease [Priestia endophytica]|uniref:ABC transporter permease n=1 Tax=Priestia endophytica TaxID=135735 RepID=UPI000DCA8499|nr:ABC transporter permease subunit [Priestia endophytica]RAS72867.1 ABC transporter permease [Priestia endophytica]